MMVRSLYVVFLAVHLNGIMQYVCVSRSALYHVNLEVGEVRARVAVGGCRKTLNDPCVPGDARDHTLRICVFDCTV